ncbi:MAG: ssDNA-binding protein [Aquidulcibacter sp.]
MANSRSEDAKTPLAIVAFAHNMFEVNNRNKFGCSLLFPKGTDISVLQKLANDAAVAEWGDKVKAMVENGMLKSPFLDGDGPQAVNKETLARHPGFAGHTFIRCVSGVDYKPKVWDRKRNPIFEKSECPSGSKGYAVVNAFAWTNDEGGKGISFGISHFQVVEKAEGDAVLGGGGGGPAADKFLEVLDDAGDAPAETKGGAGAAGLFG